MKKKLIGILFALILLIQGTNCLAQFSLRDVLDRASDQSLPFDGNKRQRSIRGMNYALSNADGQLYDKLYKDVQLKQSFVNLDEGAAGHASFRKFSLPNSVNKLLVISIGGITDFNTYILAVVSPSGRVLGQIEGEVNYFPRISIMQYRISAQGQVSVYQLVPTSTSPILFSKFTQFTARRVDKTYKITPEGKFQVISTKQYQPKTYTRVQLENRDYNLWQGNELAE